MINYVLTKKMNTHNIYTGQNLKTATFVTLISPNKSADSSKLDFYYFVRLSSMIGSQKLVMFVYKFHKKYTVAFETFLRTIIALKVAAPPNCKAENRHKSFESLF